MPTPIQQEELLSAEFAQTYTCYMVWIPSCGREKHWQNCWFAGYKGYFTGHSLRRTGTARLSNAGVPTKIIKECTGHRSDTVNKYQVMSDAQKEACSHIVSGKSNVYTTVSRPPTTFDSITKSNGSDESVNKVVEEKVENPKCASCSKNNMFTAVNDLLKSLEGTGTAKIKIEFTKDK